MSTTKCSRAPGRPRNFDPELAVAKVQPLFHAHGYDAVSVADVTQALNINPPSFYAAFGNKIGLYERVLGRYVQTDAIPFDDILRSDRPVAESLAALLEEAARRYAADPHAPGCLVLEGTHSNDPQARQVARAFYSVAEHKIHDFIAQRHPEVADSLTDYISTTMLGLSGKARCGHTLERLLSSAHIASQAVLHQLS
ncbi:TetR/AcrR family transcriptional regulator [Citrobacter cronae]|uniref:TetR/AcrR family transcriptional regulator n=1 Tax=Citrobacter cronae TaxID=1748967 RepID=UPI002DBA23AF|nr:TetR/AcrR family transcriptional regulator [Citrobacter cronae]MEB5756469.1 TetR/AcrR family transcriptional regulator [Citrobacter cronae]